MTLTRSFKETIKARIERDTEFKAAFLLEGIECLLSGEVDTGKTILRDYINATIGFESLSEITNTPPKSLMRMFSQKGNPQASNLFAVISHLQAHSGIRLQVKAMEK